MAAMHGRDDALLEAGRFSRLLRQANDAEIADVRKIGEDDYEITASPKAPLLPPAPTPAREEPVVELVPTPEAIEAGVPAEALGGAGRENGVRSGVRFRRGSRGTLRPGEIPLIGVVQVETPAEVVVAPEPAIPDVAAEPAPAKKAARPRRPRKKAAATAATTATAEGPPTEPEAAPAPKRPRTRARKKAT